MTLEEIDKLLEQELDKATARAQRMQELADQCRPNRGGVLGSGNAEEYDDYVARAEEARRLEGRLDEALFALRGGASR